MNDNSTNNEVLLLSDEDGNHYAIPYAALEQYRVNPEKLHELAGASGEHDVSGYSMATTYLAEQLSNQAASARSLHAQQMEELRNKNKGEEREADAATEAKRTPARRTFVGLLATLGLSLRG